MVQFLSVIRDEAIRAAICQKPADFAKKDFGKWSEESLNKIIHNSIQLVKHKMQMKELELSQELGEGTTSSIVIPAGSNIS